ncbi:MAG TPA: VIT domain-containing protein [Thermoanaerobaculia bacterium]|nr:VIT domain-containing protein [Thermoanaerobaculia bacterium]
MRLAFSVLIALVSFAASAKTLVPTLVADTGDGRHALQLVGVRVDTIIRGHLARTECELTYRNDLNAIVEGEFNFPLPAGAELTGLGLYFNGKLRKAVAVERDRARVAYETAVHQRVDPALAEWTGANRATLRVYPIPAKGEKKVWLSYDQELLAGDYVLDLRWGKRLREVDVRIDADGRFVRDSRDVTYDRPYRLQLVDSVLDRQLIAEADARTEVLAARDENRWYLSAAPRSAATSRAVERASELVVFWDTSGSAMQQDRAALDAFLAALAARQQPGTRVTFVPFDITAGNAVSSLEGLHGIGATNYPALFARMRELMSAAPPTTRFLLVTDGLTSLGNRRDVIRAATELRALNRGLTVVNASPQTDDILLAHLATATNGWLFDLNEMTVDAAVDSAMRAAAPSTITSSAAPIVASRRLGQFNARIPIAAATDVKPYLLPLRLGDEARELPIRELRQPREIAMVRSAYARAALRELLVSLAPDEEIIEHGRRFQQLTPRTSLLVLESWRDYEQWDVPLPDDVKREKEEEEGTRGITLSVDGPATSNLWLIDAVTVDTQGWQLPGATVTLTAGRDTRIAVTNEHGRAHLGLPYVPPAFTLRAELPGLNTVDYESRTHVPSGTTVTLVMGYAAVAESITVTAEAPRIATTSAAASFISGATPANSDALIASLFANPQSDDVLANRRATLDAVAAKMATLTSVDERVRYYLTARAAFGGDKAFHLQAATLFEKDAPQLAARILTELAEAYPDDAALLRILARILEGWNEPVFARLLLQHAMETAASDEQTWRELALLESRLGNSDAIEQLARDAEVSDEEARDDILDSIEPVVERWRSGGNSARDLRFEDDADVEIDLMWDTNFSDVDLYVTEPSGEQVWYSHTKSKQGGELHEDITTGYGPEIYTLRNPAPGDYRIAIDYYGVDDTDVNFDTLAHLIVYQRTRSGVERQEYILVLSAEKEHRAVATIHVGR